MLVLSRFAGEEIRIGDDVVIRYIGMRNGAARIGVEAPPHVLILRRELEGDGGRERKAER